MAASGPAMMVLRECAAKKPGMDLEKTEQLCQEHCNTTGDIIRLQNFFVGSS